jgi:hypothetical protein
MAKTVDEEYATLDEKSISAAYQNRQGMEYENVKTINQNQQNIPISQERQNGFTSTRKLYPIWVIVVTAILAVIVSVAITAAVCLVITKSDNQQLCKGIGVILFSLSTFITV